MKRNEYKIFGYLLFIVFFLMGLPVMAQKNLQKKPNILFILADDLGWMDVTINGSKYYETPNIERLAKRGMMFSDAYTASPLCSPTRASIMSGQYPERFHLTTPSGHLSPNSDEPANSLGSGSSLRIHPKPRAASKGVLRLIRTGL